MSRLRCCSRWYCLRHHRNQLAAITDFSHHAIKSTLKRRVIVRLSIPELVPQPRAQDQANYQQNNSVSTVTTTEQKPLHAETYANPSAHKMAPSSVGSCPVLAGEHTVVHTKASNMNRLP